MASISMQGPKLADLEYRVVRTLGSGAGSTVLLVADRKTGSQYAMKIVKRQSAEDDIYIDQAIHEYDVAQRLNHPSILKIHDCRIRRAWFKTTGVELLEEYVDGKTLDDAGKLEMGPLVLAFVHVASAMKHMHRRGVYHADLKPGNIMIARNGGVKVIDFGTAWIKGQPKGRVQGTLQYMAPESAKDKIIDERTDLYNFGATMYRMFTGEYANLGGVPQMESVALGRCFRPKSPMELNSDLPGTLNETIMACLEPNPLKRPAGFFEVKHQLVAVARYMKLKSTDLDDAID